jgi:hypothetical protein
VRPEAFDIQPTSSLSTSDHSLKPCMRSRSANSIKVTSQDGPSSLAHISSFAFENLLKGIIIAKNPAIRDPTMWGTTAEEEKARKKTRDEKGLSEWMSHDVKKLLQLADISIPEPYLRLLWIFEGKAVWSGRYPTALSAPRRVRLDDEGLPDFIQLTFIHLKN